MDKDEISIEQDQNVLGGTTYEIGKESFEKMDNNSDAIDSMLKDNNNEEINLEKHI